MLENARFACYKHVKFLIEVFQMDSKVTATLLGIVLGWCLSQGTEFFKSWRTRNKKINAIRTEIADLNDWLIRMSHSVLYIIQIIELKQPIDSLPQKLYPFLIKEHFHEICMHIPREARIGITDLYASIEDINRSLSLLNEHFESNEVLGKRRYNIIISLYGQVYSTQQKCNFLKCNPDGSFEKLKKHQDSILNAHSVNISEAKKEAVNLGIEALREKYLG